MQFISLKYPHAEIPVHELVEADKLASLLIENHFPELWDEDVRITHANIKFCMAALCLPKPDGRVYCLIVGSGPRNQVNFRSLNYPQRCGLIAHELSHLLAFSKMSTWEYLLFGLRYKFSHRFRKEIERLTDIEAIRRGFGEELACYADYVANDAWTTKKYQDYKARTYLTGDEIRTIMFEMLDGFI